MLLENFIISSLIFARWAIFSTLYIGKSPGKQDLCDLGGYCMARHVIIFWNLKKCILEHTHTQPFNGLWSVTTRVGWYQKKHTHPNHGTSFILEISWKLVRLDL